jgi:hypothetical protein
MIYKMDWKKAFPWAQIPSKDPDKLFDFARVDEQNLDSPYVTFQYQENGVWKKTNMVRTVLDDIVDAGGAKWIIDTSEQAKAFLLGAI